MGGRKERRREGREGRMGWWVDRQTDRWVSEGEGTEFPLGHQPLTSRSTISEVRGFWNPAAKF